MDHDQREDAGTFTVRAYNSNDDEIFKGDHTNFKDNGGRFCIPGRVKKMKFISGSLSLDYRRWVGNLEVSINGQTKRVRCRKCEGNQKRSTKLKFVIGNALFPSTSYAICLKSCFIDVVN